MVHEFIVACKENDLNKIQQMMHMVDISINEVGFKYACYYGHIDVVKYLVQNIDIDVHARDEEGFRWACYYGHIDVVKYLVPLGVDIHAKNEYGLMWAWWNGHIDIVRYLVNFMQCVKYRKLYKISQFMPSTDSDHKRTNIYLINVGIYMNHLNNNFRL